MDRSTAYDQALWLIDNNHSVLPIDELVEELLRINNKDKEEQDRNPNLPLNNNN